MWSRTRVFIVDVGTSDERPVHEWLGGVRDQDFFIQARLGEAWHVESEKDCEIMLCGKFISSDNMVVRIQSRWGTRKCSDCWIKLEEVKLARRGY